MRKQDSPSLAMAVAEIARLIMHVTLVPEIVGAANARGELAPCMALAIFRERLELAGHQRRQNFLTKRDAIEALTVVRTIAHRRAQQIISEGESLYWRSDSKKRLWLIGLPKIAARLKVTPRLQHHRVAAAAIQTRGGMTATAARLALPLLADGRPLTRSRKAALSGVSERHQRRIDSSPRGSELREQVYASYEGQWPDGKGSFTDHRGRRLRRMGDVRIAATHTSAAPSRVSNLRRRVRKLRQPPTHKAVLATDGSNQRRRVFQHSHRHDAVRAWTRAGQPEGLLAYREGGRWRRELVGSGLDPPPG